MENTNFQLGLLHFVHLLVNVDGHFDDRERKAVLVINKEESIPDSVYDDFIKKIGNFAEEEIYDIGKEHLTACTDEERLRAFVHLYKLAESDSDIGPKEVRFLLYGLKGVNINYTDFIAKVGMSGK